LIGGVQPEISDVVVLCWSSPATADRNAFKIATFMGAEAKVISFTAAALGDSATLIEKLVLRCTCLVVDAETLAKAADAMPTGVNGVCSISRVAEHVLIYGFQGTDRHSAILRALSSGGLVRVQPLRDSNGKFQIAANHRKSCGQFSGLSFGSLDPSREGVFLEGADRRQQDVMIRAGDQPFFVRTNEGGSQVSFLACSELADLDEKTRRGSRALSWFSRLVPLMMFLRGALGNRLWRNDHPRACFIIDDPLLKTRYGFLEYRRLLESMRQKKFSTCIAFIPWNYRRSSKKVAALVSSKYGPPFLCVHGCDHTDAEFEATDPEWLVGKARLALARMRAHHQLSGVPFDDVMVFPQGRFSPEAVAALKASGYLAAVNGSACPSTMIEALTLRDLLEVAVTRFSDFPVFSRRYPRDLAEFAFDLFMGKPALAVEHHGYFRNGYEPLETFVERLKSLDERLEWTNPVTICSRACLTRAAGRGEVHVRFYTSRFWLKNNGTQTQRYLLLRRQRLDDNSRVTLDGHDWHRELDDDDLKVRVSLNAGQSAEIRVLSDACDSAGLAWKPTEAHNARVWIRRFLCEIRDNHVDTTPVLRQIVSTARSFVRHNTVTARG
jgi:hypothetical protein